MATGGWISAYAFQDGALSADTLGRAAMAANFLQTTHVADAQITYAKLASAAMLHVGVYNLDFYDMAVYG